MDSFSVSGPAVKPAELFSVSYVMGPNDNGHCVSFESRENAEGAFRELIRDGAIAVDLWSRAFTLRRFRKVGAR